MVEKNRYLKVVVSVLVVILVLVGCFFAYKELSNKNKSNSEEKKEEKQGEKITPLLYEVTKPGSNNKIYLFGSIHLANKSDLLFPDYILNAYNNSHYIACEYNMVEANSNIESIQQMAMSMMYQDGTTIKDHLSEEVYNKLIEFLTQKNSYINLYEYYKPLFFYSLISNILGNEAKITSEGGIDEYFINKATKDNKTILEVESMEFQLDLLLSFSDKLYEQTISDEIDNYDNSVNELIELYDSWKSGNIERLLELTSEDIKIEDSYSEELKQEINDYNKKLITDRNQTMTDKVIEYYENNQDVFFMVGTLHIIGEDGIANNLKEKGFTITRIQ